MAHIYALAGSAGLNYDIDRIYDYGVDGTFRHVRLLSDPAKPSGFRRIESGYALDFQAKASTKWELRDGHIVYEVEGKTYNDIVSRDQEATTLILVLLCLPKDDVEWHKTEADVTTLRHCCYWHGFSGNTVKSDSKKTIKIPVDQRLTPTVLNGLIEKETARRRAQCA